MAQRTIAIYGKGGIGKSFTTTNLAATFARMGKRVLQLGCDPKHDSTTSLFGGISLPTLTDVFAEKNAHNQQIAISDIVFRRDIEDFAEPIYGIELGGPQVGRGCGGRGIISGFDILEKLGLFSWDLDVILMDFLGDVVCGGFATPLARSLSEEVILVSSNDRQSIFTANNICRANNYFRTVGGRSKLLGMIINRDDGSGVAERYAAAAGINILMKVPYDLEARERDDRFDFAIRIPSIGRQFETLARKLLEGTLPTSEGAGLEFNEFVRLFGEVSNASPRPATSQELLGPEADNTAGTAPASAPDSDTLRMQECVNLLEEKLRLVYNLCESEGKSNAEAAAQLAIAESEVKALIGQARKELRKLFFSRP